jgi:HEAT repeat protein
MINRQAKPIACVIGAFALGAVLMGSNEATSGGGKSLLGVDAASPVQEWENRAVALSEQRVNLIEDLIRQVRSVKDHDKLIRICFLLGEYRATEAVAELASRITLEDKERAKGRLRKLPLWGRYPAQEALVKIGTHATPNMLGILTTSDDELTRQLAAEVVRDVYGREVARVVIEQALAKQTDAQKRKRLDEALKFVK